MAPDYHEIELAKNEQLTIVVNGEPVHVMNCEVQHTPQGDKARIGTNAPPQITVHRSEVQERIQQEQRGR